MHFNSLCETFEMHKIYFFNQLSDSVLTFSLMLHHVIILHCEVNNKGNSNYITACNINEIFWKVLRDALVSVLII